MLSLWLCSFKQTFTVRVGICSVSFSPGCLGSWILAFKKWQRRLAFFLRPQVVLWCEGHCPATHWRRGASATMTDDFDHSSDAEWFCKFDFQDVYRYQLEEGKSGNWTVWNPQVQEWMEPLVISHGYGLPGIQLAHQLGLWNLLEQRYLTLRSGMRMIFLKRKLKRIILFSPCRGEGWILLMTSIMQ